MASSPAPLNANTTWGGQYAYTLRNIIHEHASRAPRSLQSHLGPSELGSSCSRQVAGKMAALPVTNHVSDPWPSIRGTALHAWVAEAFMADNTRKGRIRWVAEQKVTPHPDHPGTCDLYDAESRSVTDWKFLGASSMAKIKSPDGPPRHYVVQLLMYGLGYRLLGLPVDRVVIAACPATAASLDGMYIWERPYTPADDVLLEEVFQETKVRREWANKIIAGTATLNDVPSHPSDQNCFFCFAYRPDSPGATNSCTGHSPGR